MNSKNDRPKHAAFDAKTWELLGEDAAPHLEDSLWPDVQRRLAGESRGGWLPRLSFVGMGVACLVAGLWFGLGLSSRIDEPKTILSEVDFIEGSFLGGSAWTLDDLYQMAEAEITPTGDMR